jgi:hypothetical protein
MLCTTFDFVEHTGWGGGDHLARTLDLWVPSQ